MASLIDDVRIINNALARFAGGAIGALGEDTDLNTLVEPLYRDIREAAFALYDWRFNRRTRPCSRLDEPILNGWGTVHAFPAGMLAAPTLVLADPRQPDQPLRAYAIEGRRIYCDVARIWAAGPLAIDPDEWPPTFRDALTHWLAAELVVPLTHDTGLAEKMRVDAIGTPSEGGRGGRMGRAIAVDIATGGQIPNVLASDPLTAAHTSGGGTCAAPWHGDF